MATEVCPTCGYPMLHFGPTERGTTTHVCPWGHAVKFSSTVATAILGIACDNYYAEQSARVLSLHRQTTVDGNLYCENDECEIREIPIEQAEHHSVDGSFWCPRCHELLVTPWRPKQEREADHVQG